MPIAAIPLQLLTLVGYHKWTKMASSTSREGRWVIRRMLWINKDVEAEQVLIESSDLLADMGNDNQFLLPAVDNPARSPTFAHLLLEENR